MASRRKVKSKITLDHDEIRRWAEARNGHPAVVKGTEILRIDFPGYKGKAELQPISWEEFFEIFERKNLAFLYQDRTASGGISRFAKFVDCAEMSKDQVA